MGGGGDTAIFVTLDQALHHRLSPTHNMCVETYDK